jgi:imidazolonepropionase-like amidohydrolase
MTGSFTLPVARAVRDAIRDHVDRGAVVIKVMATGGHMTSGPAPDVLAAGQFSSEELRAAADEAHRQQLPITAHAHGRDGIVATLQAGFDGVEHVADSARLTGRTRVQLQQNETSSRTGASGDFRSPASFIHTNTGWSARKRGAA